MKKCDKCGTPIPDISRFCLKCGSYIDSSIDSHIISVTKVSSGCDSIRSIPQPPPRKSVLDEDIYQVKSTVSDDVNIAPFLFFCLIVTIIYALSNEQFRDYYFSSDKVINKELIQPCTLFDGDIFDGDIEELTDTSVGYVVQIAAPASKLAALKLRDKVCAHGFKSYILVVDTDSGIRYRVRIGPVNSRKAAAELLDAIKHKTGIDGIVVKNP